MSVEIICFMFDCDEEYVFALGSQLRVTSYLALELDNSYKLRAFPFYTRIMSYFLTLFMKYVTL